jgi:hypothetical protein
VKTAGKPEFAAPFYGAKNLLCAAQQGSRMKGQQDDFDKGQVR